MTDQHKDETGSPGMLGTPGTEPTPDMPQTAGPVGASEGSPSRSEGLPPEVTGTASTRSANDVLGTPGNVAPAEAGDEEPGTPGTPGTPTPGLTGAEPNTIDTTAQS